MTNRAQILEPITIDMFNVIAPGNRVTFTDNGAPAGYYFLTPDGSETPVLIPAEEIRKHAKFYTQCSIF